MARRRATASAVSPPLGCRIARIAPARSWLPLVPRMSAFVRETSTAGLLYRLLRPPSLVVVASAAPAGRLLVALVGGKSSAPACPLPLLRMPASHPAPSAAALFAAFVGRFPRVAPFCCWFGRRSRLRWVSFARIWSGALKTDRRALSHLRFAVGSSLLPCVCRRGRCCGCSSRLPLAGCSSSCARGGAV